MKVISFDIWMIIFVMFLIPIKEHIKNISDLPPHLFIMTNFFILMSIIIMCIFLLFCCKLRGFRYLDIYTGCHKISKYYLILYFITGVGSIILIGVDIQIMFMVMMLVLLSMSEKEVKNEPITKLYTVPELKL